MVFRTYVDRGSRAVQWRIARDQPRDDTPRLMYGLTKIFDLIEDVHSLLLNNDLSCGVRKADTNRHCMHGIKCHHVCFARKCFDTQGSFVPRVALSQYVGVVRKRFVEVICNEIATLSGLVT